MNIVNMEVIEYCDMPKEIQDKLVDYYTGTNHRAIHNGDYTRFPYLSDIGYAKEEGYDSTIDDYLISKGISGYAVIIHWDW